LKATGIVRRIDDLGRVVIPKEIRRTLRIREGDPLEIFTDREGEVILKKYSPIGELGEFARQFADSIHRCVGHVALVCDKDMILSVAGGSRKEYADRAISAQVEQLLQDRKTLEAGFGKDDPITILAEEEDGAAYSNQIVVPIISEGEDIGAVMLVSKDHQARMGECELKVCQTAASFIGKHMEQ
jgi:AbrB family transcriptional regulator (stage V sporulation protein T)